MAAPRHFGPASRAWSTRTQPSTWPRASVPPPPAALRSHTTTWTTPAAEQHDTRGGGLLRASAAHTTAPTLPAESPWRQAVCGYVSILRLAQACLWRAKEDDRGFECAVEALLGVRGGSRALGEGAVAMRMLQLAPLPAMLRIPLDHVYITPYEILSYVMDNMVPVLRHVAAMELASCRRFADQMQRWEEEEAGGGGTAAGRGKGGWGAQVRRDNHSHNLLYQQQQQEWLQQQQPQPLSDGSVPSMPRESAEANRMYEPFLTVMSDILQALARCLAELPAEVLRPDFHADCAATFFIFRNCARHLMHVFQVQRGTGTVWETFALLLVSRFMDVLTMIGRNPQYTARVAELLSGAQEDCPELQWTSLLSQALACAGLRAQEEEVVVAAPNTTATTTTNPTTTSTNPTTTSRVYASLYADPYPREESTRAGREVWGESRGQATAASSSSHRGTLPAPSHTRTAALLPDDDSALPREFTRSYARDVQQQFIISFFMLLRQMCSEGSLVQRTVTELLPLDFCLALLTAPQQSQATLGSTLSLIAARVQSTADAMRVWSFVQRRQLLQEPSYQSVRTAARVTSASPFRTELAARSADSPDAGSSRVRILSLLGHCRYEAAHGLYEITVGTLHLMMALLTRQPSAALGWQDSDTATMQRVMYFISHEVLRGVLRRPFVVERQRDVVFALAAAVLRQALASLTRVRSAALPAPMSSGVGLPSSQDEDTRTTRVSPPLLFATLVALDKAPHDAVGEVLRLVTRAARQPHALTSDQRAAVRQGIHLLAVTVAAAAAHAVELFALDARISRNTTLPRQLLALCAVCDARLTRRALELLQCLPATTMQRAVHALHASAASDAEGWWCMVARTRLTALLVDGKGVHQRQQRQRPSWPAWTRSRRAPAPRHRRRARGSDCSRCCCSTPVAQPPPGRCGSVVCTPPHRRAQWSSPTRSRAGHS